MLTSIWIRNVGGFAQPCREQCVEEIDECRCDRLFQPISSSSGEESSGDSS